MKLYGITINRGSELSATRQLCDALRALIHAAKLLPGDRLPSSRAAATALGVSRIVTLGAYEQLIAEGYLVGRSGSGTYVAEALAPPADIPAGMGSQTPLRYIGRKAPRRSIPHDAEPAVNSANRVIDFDMASGTPDLAGFPFASWTACLRDAAAEVKSPDLWHGDPAGDPALREAIAAYLFRSKGFAPAPGNVFIASGARDGIFQIAVFLSRRLSSVIVEDPTLPSVRSLLESVGLAVQAARVDDDGMTVDEEGPAVPPGRLIVVTPAHQYPTGAILSARRRFELVTLARKGGDFIVEDDYDGEFRYQGIPVPPLATLAPDRTIHVGTFSKTLFPGIRLGYLVMPRSLVEEFVQFRRSVISWPAVIDQRALARFIGTGQFERHVYRMRRTYASRSEALRDAVSRAFGSTARIAGTAAGLHVRVDLKAPEIGNVDWTQSQGLGVKVTPLASLGSGHYRRSIALGFGNLSGETIREGIRRLASFLKSVKTR